MSRISRRNFLRNAAVSGAVLSQQRVFASAPLPTSGEPDWARLKLFYNHPAPTWSDALPVGNGRLGAMVFGNPSIERIQLNEESIWDGERRDRDNPEAAAAVPEIRKLLFTGKVEEAEALATSGMFSIPRRMPCYQTLGDLHLDFSSMGITPDTKVDDYRHELDLDRAICTTTFTHASVRYTREVFASASDQVIVIRLTASQPNKISFSAKLDRPGPTRFVDYSPDLQTLQLEGSALPVNDNPHLPVKERQTGVHYLAELRLIAEGKAASFPGPSNRSTSIGVAHANAVTLLLDCSTSFRHPATSGANPENVGDIGAMRGAVVHNLNAAQVRSYAELRTRHIADYQPIFRRVTLELGASDPGVNIPTDVRLQKLKAGGDDAGLLTLHFQYGRYLLIASSRPGTLASNLQGIWNEYVDPPWGSKYTININAQMNYWIADRTNLGELHTPLFDLLDSTRAAGARVAKSYYGAKGFVVHHNTDIWGDAGPIDTLGGGIWAMGGAWLATHLWDHYLYTGNTEFLRARAYPRLKETSTFLLDYLTPSPDGHLVTGPSCSPENAYLLPNGKKANLCMAPTMDIAIVRAVFDQTARAAQILNVDADLCEKIAAAKAKLPEYKIGHNGGLQEWPEDYAESEPGHRHISHLWGLYPDDQITLRGTPELAQACRKTLDLRLAAGGGSTGWSRSWVINCFARLEDGDRCHQQLLELLRLSTRDNLFDVCGIKANSLYQIDGNLGTPAGMAEMLIQSHGGVVRLLPALPSAWPDGRFRGLCARGGYTVDLTWRNGKADKATLTTSLDGDCMLALPKGQRLASATSKLQKAAFTPTAEGCYRLSTKRGQTYALSFG